MYSGTPLIPATFKYIYIYTSKHPFMHSLGSIQNRYVKDNTSTTNEESHSFADEKKNEKKNQSVRSLSIFLFISIHKQEVSKENERDKERLT